ncbi:MAG: sigma-70 family RNA polymerase sigma factor [Myxococcales bacterium]|nr:sigma-70 family RNA polymerase sigma factor [Myxococcales bacterium]
MPASDAPDLLDSLSTVMRQGRGSLAALARGEGLGPEEAVDCVQEGCASLLGMARRGEVTDDASGWGALLATIVRNLARNRRRRHFLALPHRPLEELPLIEDAPSSDALIAQAEEHVRLRACVLELCDTQRAVVTLRMLEERSGDDVARTLGISAAHVATLLYRAKRSLRACMRE